jgi:L-ascorbate metabolism protein UlaG (beta-lactamase superfamily)
MKRVTVAALAALAVLALLAGACVPTGPVVHAPVSDHFDGARFHNVPEVGSRGLGDVLAWQLFAKSGVPWPDWISTPPGEKPPARVTEGVRITPIGHATVLVQFAGINVLTDPIWSERASPFSGVGPRRHRDPALRQEDLPPLDAIVISHNHYDHMDLPTLRALVPPGSPTKIFVPLGNAAFLAEQGIAATDLDWATGPESCASLGGLSVCAVPAQHHATRSLTDENRSLWSGWYLRRGGSAESVYFAGDTGFGPHFHGIREPFGSPCVALLPIGAYLPRPFTRIHHMDPKEAVVAFDVLGAKHAVPIHFGTFDLSDEGVDDPTRELEASRTKGHVRDFLFPGFGHGRTFRCAD